MQKTSSIWSRFGPDWGRFLRFHAKTSQSGPKKQDQIGDVFLTVYAKNVLDLVPFLGPHGGRLRFFSKNVLNLVLKTGPDWGRFCMKTLKKRPQSGPKNGTRLRTFCMALKNVLNLVLKTGPDWGRFAWKKTLKKRPQSGPKNGTRLRTFFAWKNSQKTSSIWS